MTNLFAKGLSFSYGKESVLKDISLELKTGTLTALVGPNGAGKSTLLRLLQGQVMPHEGKIFLDEHPLGANRNQVALMPQRSSINWNFPITTEGLVALGQVNTDNQSCCKTEASLQRVGLAALAKKRLDSLSGGQQQRALLAKTLAQNASVFLLDEPCAALDPPSREQFLSIIRQLAEAGLTIFVSSHDWGQALNAYDKVITLDRTVLAFGTPEEVRSKLQSISSMGNHCYG
ncbi:ABC transporter ATP-binding protein [Prochlorococcus sp. MIT 1300]|uniref:ABC transporter ATP-binding protein n=1 Tax=Prochlorococcus sp. MIT 1300 TaxID=3096218 RepID=UPI002A75A571|nr:ABC transporter ATP-binding protein [Prochlorococcus sp. MIT 1300]